MLGMTSPFKLAHASCADWTDAARDCLAQLGAIPAAATLGFLYVSDAYVAEMEAILAFFKNATGVTHWTGTVGVGVCATATEYLDMPAMAVMLGEFDSRDFQILPTLVTPADVSAYEMHGAWFAVVHGDPSNRHIQQLISGLSARLSSGFAVGGLSSSRGAIAQYADHVTHGGLSGVLFSERVRLATRLSQGISPRGVCHRITDAEENVIGRLDHRPALDVMKEEIGEVLARDLPHAPGVVFAGLPITGSDRGDYVVRNIIGVDAQNGQVAINDYVSVGGELMFCRRDEQSAEDDLKRMLSAIGGQLNAPVRGGLYYSCLGRGQYMFGTQNHELELIRNALGEFPLVGFFANGEISHNRLYGYTGVLTLFA
jgi:small ligand-binding sensory domain FIST